MSHQQLNESPHHFSQPQQTLQVNHITIQHLPNLLIPIIPLSQQHPSHSLTPTSKPLIHYSQKRGNSVIILLDNHAIPAHHFAFFCWKWALPSSSCVPLMVAVSSAIFANPAMTNLLMEPMLFTMMTNTKTMKWEWNWRMENEMERRSFWRVGSHGWNWTTGME